MTARRLGGEIEQAVAKPRSHDGPSRLAAGLYELFASLAADNLIFRLDVARLRILMYHGVCEDSWAEEDWVPKSFVTQSAFEAQVQYLRRHTCVLSLQEAVEKLRHRRLPPRAVAITFDDGYANNLHLALPLLRKYAVPATIFLSTSYLESGELFIPDRLRLIALAGCGHLSGPGNPFLEYSTGPLDTVVERADAQWTAVKMRLLPQQMDALRPLRVQELAEFDPQLIELGAHSHHHCILGNETPQRREWEIRKSVEQVQAWTGKPVRFFAYPNGARGDFSGFDQEVLRSLNIDAAVSSIPGANSRDCDFLALRRYPVGLYHDEHIFVSEIAGFRTALRALTFWHGSRETASN